MGLFKKKVKAYSYDKERMKPVIKPVYAQVSRWLGLRIFIPER